MRLLKLLLTGLLAIAALVTGLFVAALVGLGGVALLLVRRFFGPSRPRPQAAQSFGPAATVRADEAIEVTATDITAADRGDR